MAFHSLAEASDMCQDQHMFHIACERGLIFLCMADEAFGRRIPFAFLEACAAACCLVFTAHALTPVQAAGRQAAVPRAARGGSAVGWRLPL